MSERERLAADARHLDWLADARLGPVHMKNAFRLSFSGNNRRAERPLGLWRHGLAVALSLVHRLRSVEPKFAGSRANAAEAPGR
jgi:hypothetical protein